MVYVDKEMLYIDIDDHDQRLEVDVAVRQQCEESWAWDHTAAEWGDRLPSLLVWLVHRGGAELRTSRGDFNVCRGDFLVMPSWGIEYHGRHTPEQHFEVTWLFFSALGLSGATGGVAGIPFHTSLTDRSTAEILMGRVLESAPSMQGVWLRALLDEVRRQHMVSGLSEPGGRMRELAVQIQANPGRYHGLDDMQQDYPYSKDHLIRLFRSQNGVTPVEFLIRARIDSARALLSASNFSIKEIAAQLGYADTFCFSRQFKARTNLSPSAFRASCLR